MRKRGGATGFTIIETLIFLAVSVAMLASVMFIFGGVQSRRQFSHSMRDIDSKFQDIINDVSAGYFDELKGYTCNSGVGNSKPTFSAGASGQGTNLGCIFLGKVILLSPSTKKDSIEISTVVGNRQKGSRDVSTYTEAYPTTVFNNTAPLIFDQTISYEIPWGVEVRSAKVNGADTYATGFYGSLANSSGGSATDSGAQKVVHFKHNITTPNNTRLALKNCISTVGFCGFTPITHPWVICFWRGDPNETAQLTIGGNGTLTTKLEFVSCT